MSNEEHYSRRNRTTGFRMWKSGKQWLYGLGVVSAVFLNGEMQAFAQEVEPLVAPGIEQSLDQNILAADEQAVETSPEVEETNWVSQDSLTESETTSPAVEIVSEQVAETKATPTNEKEQAVAQETDASQVTEETEKAETSQDSQEESKPKEIKELNLSKLFDEEKEEAATAKTLLRSQDTTETVDVTTAKPVTIHYEPSNGDLEDNYYVHVWGDGLSSDMRSQDLKMTQDGNQFKITITPLSDATDFNYIIKKGQNWDNKRTQEMTATVNSITETDIYVGDDYYSQLTNLQSPEFDRMFGYEDKRVNGDAEDKFETVGSLGRLGATLNEDGTATINLWAPTAKEVTLNLYTDLSPEATASHQVKMVRGTDYNPDDHTANTVGVWTYTISQDDLAALGIDSANKLAYDYSLTLPNQHMIQVEGGANGAKTFRNSATGETLIWNGGNREEVSAFYTKGGAYQTVTTQDPYSVAVIQGGTRSVILDITKVGEKVTNSNNKRATTNSQVSVLEMNVRDFSIDSSSGVSEANKGNYLGVVESGTTTESGTMTGIDYLKYRGVNYVQMMPLNDFETVPELDKDDPENNKISDPEPDGVHNNQQNWGYDPKNYNVPEGSYSSDPADPESRIAELKQMVQGLHDAGINVILDVVYNHLYHGQENVFEWTVPGYYYAINMPANVMNNDIFVGNAVRANSEMMRRYIVNSTAFWAAEYGMDGFRFDAMSDLDITTLNAVRDALDEVGPNIITYGEGWDSMGKYLPAGENGSDSHGKDMPTYGFFDATSRNSIVGHAYNEDLDAPGFANEHHDAYNKENPHIANPSDVAMSLLGGNRGKYANASQQLNYVECHDGMTLNDILKRYNEIDKNNPDIHLNRVELATAMSALAQGIHFSQHGQEFLRTKNDAVNTYNSGDLYNRIDWDLVTENADAVNFSKAITQLRLAEPLFQLSEYSDIDQHMVITNAQPSSGIITYELRLDGQGENENGKYLVVFNNNTQPENDGALTLGGDSWYYGTQEGYDDKHNTEGNRGIINETNDFSNAFIVATNSKNLYDRIGQEVGETTITMDRLTATVLFIPAPAKAVELVQKERVINYVDTNNKAVAKTEIQNLTLLTVEETDLNLKFSFEESQIPTTDKDLGNKENIVSGVADTNARVQRLYIAKDAEGQFIKADLELSKVEIGADGKPVNTDNIKWELVSDIAYLVNAPEGFEDTEFFTSDKEKWLSSSAIALPEVQHPSVPGYKVINIDPKSEGDLSQVNEKILTLSKELVTVTYAKKSVAKLISENDPAETLPKSEETATGNYLYEGVVDDAIQFTITDDDLARPSYRYTVNGKASLAEALKDSKLTDKTSVFTVVYTPITGSVIVNYVDGDGKPISGPETGNQSSLTHKADTTLIDEDYNTTNLRPETITVNGEKYYYVSTKGLTPTGTEAEEIGKVTEGQTTITYTYKPATVETSDPVDTKASLTVIVVADGQEIAKEVTEHVIAQTTTTTLTKPDDTVISETPNTTPVDAPYDVTAKGKNTITLNDKTYYLVETTGQAKGNLTQDTTVTFTYKPAIEEIEVEESKATLTVKFVDDNGVELAQSVTQEFVVGKTTTTTILHPNGNELDHDFEVEHLPASYDVSDLAKESLDIDGVTYQLLVTEGELKGTLTADKTIVLTYQPLDITTSWVDTEGNALKDDEKGVAEAGEFDGYVFVMTATDDNGNAKHFFFKKPEPEIIEVEKEVEVVKEVPVEKIVEVIKVVPTEVPVEVVKEVPVEKVVEVIKEVEVEKIVEITKEVPVETIKTVVTEVPVEVIKEVPVEIIKTVPVEVIKEIPVEVIKTVEVEKLIEVTKEIPVEVVKTVVTEVPVEVIKTIEVEKLIEVIKEVPTEVIKEVPVEIIKTVPVEVIKEIPVEVIKTVEVEKLIEVTKEIPVEVVKTVVTEVPVEVIKTIEVEKLVEIIKEVPTEIIKEVPVEIIKTVPVEVIKTVVTEVPVEVIKTVEVEKLIEVIKEVPTEVIKEVPVEIIKTVPVEVIKEIPVEVIKTVEVEKLIEVTKEIPVEVVKTVVTEIPVEVIREVPVERIVTVIQEVPVETIKEITKTVEVEKIVEVIKEVPVDRIVEVIKEVPVDRIVEVTKEVPVEKVVEVVKEVPVEIIKTVEVEKIVEIIKEVPVETPSLEPTEENLELYGSVMARYMTEDGIALEEDTVVLYNALVGEHYDTVEKAFDGYECYCVDEAGAPTSGEVIEGEQIVTYLYRAILLTDESNSAAELIPTEEADEEIGINDPGETAEPLPVFPLDQVPNQETDSNMEQETKLGGGAASAGQDEQVQEAPVANKQGTVTSPKLLTPAGGADAAGNQQKALSTAKQTMAPAQSKRESLPHTGEETNHLAMLGSSLLLTAMGMMSSRRRKED